MVEQGMHYMDTVPVYKQWWCLKNALSFRHPTITIFVYGTSVQVVSVFLLLFFVLLLLLLL